MGVIANLSSLVSLQVQNPATNFFLMNWSMNARIWKSKSVLMQWALSIWNLQCSLSIQDINDITGSL